MKARFPGVLLVCITLIFSVVACSGDKTAPNGMTGAEILTMSDSAAVNQLQFTAIAHMNIMGETSEMYMSGAGDNLNEEMYLIETSPEEPDYIIQVYMVDGWLYMNDPYDSTHWVRTELNEDIWEEQNTFSQQMALLEGFTGAKYVGMENIGGSNCYKIEVEPNWEALFELSGSGDDEDITPEEIAEMIKDSSCIAWIAENTYYPMQIFFSMTIDMQIMGEMGMEMTMTFSNLNQPVTVDLPPGANGATTISYDDFVEGNW